MLLHQGGHGGVLLIQHEDSSKFVQLMKRGRGSMDNYIHFGFPDAEWSRTYFDPLQSRLSDSGFQPSVVQAHEKGVRRFLVVNALNPEDAAQVASIAAAIMGIENGSFTIHYDGPGNSPEETRELYEQARESLRTRLRNGRTRRAKRSSGRPNDA
jgi:hypothetical protein